MLINTQIGYKFSSRSSRKIKTPRSFQRGVLCFQNFFKRRGCVQR